jgi:hypothetical protein
MVPGQIRFKKRIAVMSAQLKTSFSVTFYSAFTNSSLLLPSSGPMKTTLPGVFFLCPSFFPLLFYALAVRPAAVIFSVPETGEQV